MSMQIRGVTYDTGTTTIEGALTREHLTVEQIELEMQMIANELHCNAVRITGRDLDRLKLVAEVAIRMGLDVWFSPALHNANEAETLAYIAEAARTAEELRQLGREVVLVVGCELSVFMAGMLPGYSMMDRLASLMDLSRWPAEFFALGSPIERFKTFMARAVEEARGCFKGRITYASGMWEEIDWSIFDIVGVDAYRDAGNASHFRESIRSYLQHGKPVVVTEFGCCTYKGAENKGGIGWAVIDRKATPWKLQDGIVRDEGVQARYLTELLELFEEERLAGAFVFTFVSPSYPSNEEPQFDLDTASYSLVRAWLEGTGPKLNLEPKDAYHAVSKCYGAKI